MRTSALATALVVLLTLPVTASPPAATKVDTSFLREWSITRGFQLGRPVKVKLAPDGKSALFLRSESHKRTLRLFETDLSTGKTRLLVDPTALLGGQEHLSPEEKARRERQRELGEGIANYWLDRDGGRILLQLGTVPYIFDRAAGTAHPLPVQGPVVDAKWSPDGSMVSYVRNHDVYALELASGKELALTTGGTVEQSHGEAEFVAQEELDRFTGYWWAPDSRQIAFEEVDNRKVESWNISDPLHPEVAPFHQSYPRPGKPNVRARLGLVRVGTAEQPRWVEWDAARWEYLAGVRWEKGEPLTVTLLDRPQRTLTCFEASDGDAPALKPLRSQHDQAWVNVYQDLPAFSADGSFLTVETRSGHERLCRVKGSQITEVLPGEQLSRYVNHDPKRDVAYLLTDAGPGDPRARAVARDGSVTRFPEHGVVDLAYCEGKNLVALTSHTMDHLLVTTIYRDGKRLLELPKVASEPAAVHEQWVRLKKPDGSLWLNAGVVRPRSFRPGRKYPVVVYVYGGPHHLQVTQSKGTWLVGQWLADQGYIVVSIDNRGTPGRERSFETAVYGRFGSVPLADQVNGLQALGRQLPELDLRHVGIFGWSFGGYMSAQAVLRRPDVFQAAVAGAPVTDWEDYDSCYTERYLGTLPASRANYDSASLIPLAPGLRRPLLLVHGSADDNVYYRHSLKLSQALIKAGRPFELMTLPGVTHLYTRDPLITERVWARVATFVSEHLR